MSPLPKCLYRPNDMEKFVLIGDLYYLEANVLSFPDNEHIGYTYSRLKSLGFQENYEQALAYKPKSRDVHVAEFWKSFYDSIYKAGGNTTSFNPKMTLQEISDVLAQNGIRFCYENKNKK